MDIINKQTNKNINKIGCNNKTVKITKLKNPPRQLIPDLNIKNSSKINN